MPCFLIFLNCPSVFAITSHRPPFSPICALLICPPYAYSRLSPPSLAQPGFKYKRSLLLLSKTSSIPSLNIAPLPYRLYVSIFDVRLRFNQLSIVALEPVDCFMWPRHTP